MKRKSLLAISLTLSLMLAMATPAFAANVDVNVNKDGVEVTAPGSPVYDKGNGGNTQTAGQSYNEANITSANGTNWETVNDDDKLAGALDTNGADINVWAKVTDNGTKIYKVDLAWGAMKFEYDSGGGKWNTATHAYDTVQGAALWTASYLDGTNNKVAITNHSNNAVDAGFAYAMNGTPFNDINGVDNVVGNFFADNAKSAAAATVLKGTYTDANGTVNAAAVADKLAGGKVSLPTADAYNSTTGEGSATDASKNVIAGSRAKDVYFAFSGTPDKGKGATLDTFKKVGVITVTVTPNTSVELNRPAFK